MNREEDRKSGSYTNANEMWKKSWELGDIGFHCEVFHSQIVKYFPSFLVRSKASERGYKSRVFVPLCGKSKDMLWLREQGHEVLGVELSAIACEAFFDENSLQCKKVEKMGSVVFEGTGQAEGIVIWCDDIFKLNPTLWADCSAVYDRAAIVALSEGAQLAYVQLITAWGAGAAEGSPLLQIAVEYPLNELTGPPFSVVESDLKMFYSKKFNIELLSSVRDTRRPGKHVTEKTYLLTVK